MTDAIVRELDRLRKVEKTQAEEIEQLVRERDIAVMNQTQSGYDEMYRIAKHHEERADKAERERDDALEAKIEAEERFAETWPKWATQILDMLVEYGFTPDDEVDLPQEVANWLSEFDPKDHKARIKAERELADALAVLRQIREFYRCHGEDHRDQPQAYLWADAFLAKQEPTP